MLYCLLFWSSYLRVDGKWPVCLSDIFCLLPIAIVFHWWWCWTWYCQWRQAASLPVWDLLPAACQAASAKLQPCLQFIWPSTTIYWPITSNISRVCVLDLLLAGCQVATLLAIYLTQYHYIVTYYHRYIYRVCVLYLLLAACQAATLQAIYLRAIKWFSSVQF